MFGLLGGPGYNGDGQQVGLLGIPTDTKHENKWMQYPGMAIGGLVGSLFPGFGTMIGARAGRHAGGDFGDLIGGNWDGLGASVQDQLTQGIQGPMPGMSPFGAMNPLSMLMGGRGMR
jgi:hypothetical protein